LSRKVTKAPISSTTVPSARADGWPLWIKKIRDRQTEAVLVQIKSLQALEAILDEIKKQNV
jgi:hypothetical protein